MELRSSGGDTLRLEIVGYQFPELQANEYDSNWLRIRVSASSTARSWSSVDPSLLTWEVAALASWLDRLASEGLHQEELHFIEPNLAFRVESRAVLRVYFELESRPPWAARRTAPEEDFWLEFPQDPDMLRAVAADLREQLGHYPQRAAS